MLEIANKEDRLIVCVWCLKYNNKVLWASIPNSCCNFITNLLSTSIKHHFTLLNKKVTLENLYLKEWSIFQFYKHFCNLKTCIFSNVFKKLTMLTGRSNFHIKTIAQIISFWIKQYSNVTVDHINWMNQLSYIQILM